MVTDPDQLELAILNLAVNSRDAMPDGGLIRTESEACMERSAGEGESAAHVAIRVVDQGAGMTADVVAHAFEPFFTTKERGKGTGLGLAQVYGFARQCGGDLRIFSTPGVGTTATIVLRSTTPSLEEPRSTVAAIPVEALPAHGRQVLVIDDDDGVRAVIVDTLLSAGFNVIQVSAGFNVIQASDGESGLTLLDRSNRPPRLSIS